MGSLTLTTTLEPRGPAAAIVLDDDQVAMIGEGAKRFPVALTANGRTFRGSVARMRGENLLGLSRAARSELGVEAGDTVQAQIVLDSEERTVELPGPLAAALDADPEARRSFDGMAYTHRKEYARWVAEARRPETRERRVAQAVEMIRAGRTRS